MVHEYHPATTGNEALELIRRYRSHMADVPSVEPLAHEFPYLTHELGLQGVTLFDLSANRAGTFKWRGALAGADHLRRQGTPGLIAPSAGNHARGAILAGELFGLPTTVIVPTTAPELKQQGLRGLWDSTLLRVYARGGTLTIHCRMLILLAVIYYTLTMTPRSLRDRALLSMICCN